MRLATAYVEVRPDVSKFKGDLEKQVTDDAAAVGKKLAGVLAGGAFLAGAKKATDAASQLQQAVGGTDAVFGASADAVEDWAKRAAGAAGLSERAARELTSQIGGLLKGFGFTESEAADLSTQLAQLGADLAATFGGNPEDAVIALGAALRGETDPLERFGIALNQTLVNQKAVELGLAATTSAVDQHAKAQATLSLIMERSADAQGQFGREAESAAGQAAIAAAKAENSAADLGETLLPFYAKINEVVGAVADTFGALPEPVQSGLIALAGIVALTGPVKLAGEAIASLATIARTVLTRSLDVAAGAAYDLSGSMGKAALAAGAMGIAVTAVATAIMEQQAQAQAAKDRIDGFKDAIVDAGDAATGAAARIATLADDAPELASVLDAAGVSATDLGAALVGTDADFASMRDRLLESADGAGLTDQQMSLLGRTLDALRGEAQTAVTQADELATATTGVGDAAGGAAPKVDELTEALDLDEEAAKRAAESVDLFREAVEKALAPLDLAAAKDERAQALSDLAADVEERARAVADARRRLAELQAAPAEDQDKAAIREAQRELQEAIEATSLTLEGNSDAARRNRDELRGLVDDSVAVLEAARDQGKSLDELKLIRAGEIQSLRDQLTQMGYNESQVEDYIDVIEGIPLTKSTTLTVDGAKAEIQLERWIARLQRQIDLNPLSIDVLQAEKFAAGPRTSGHGYAAGGFPLDGDFLVHQDEILRKKGASLEVIAGPAPSPVGGQVNTFAIYVVGTTGESPAEALHRSARRIAEEVNSRA